VELAQSIFGALSECKALVIGAGEMASLVAKHLKDRGCRNLSFVNRTFQRAEELAKTYDGRPFPFEQLSSLLAESDIVITSTGALKPIITREFLAEAISKRAYRPLFIIDIAVPRDVEASDVEFENLFLYNIDDLQNVVEEHIGMRKIEAEKALQIVKEEADKFLSVVSNFSVVPLIRSIREFAEEKRKQEFEKFLLRNRELPAEVLSEVEAFSKALLAKWLHNPTVALKEKGATTKENLIEIAELFGLPPKSIPETPVVPLEKQEPETKDAKISAPSAMK